MRSQPNRNYVSNDDIQTPPALARRLVEHFKPAGHILEPCAGEGNFLRALRSHARSRNSHVRSATRPSTSSLKLSTGARIRPTRVAWCEAKRHRDFLSHTQPVNWIITNPPWSQVRRFLQHALSLADHVVFLITINHLWTRARQHDIKSAGFGLKEIVLFDTPKNFPPMGFQVGAVYLRRGWKGLVKITDWTSAPASAQSRHSSAGATAEPPTDPLLEELRALNRHLDALLAKVAKPKALRSQ